MSNKTRLVDSEQLNDLDYKFAIDQRMGLGGDKVKGLGLIHQVMAAAIATQEFRVIEAGRLPSAGTLVANTRIRNREALAPSAEVAREPERGLDTPAF